MAEKTVVFGGQQGVNKGLGDFVKNQGVALLLAKLAYQVALAGIDPHGGLQFDVAQTLNIWQAGLKYR